MAGDLTRKQKQKGKHPEVLKLTKELQHWEALAPHDPKAKKKVDEIRRKLAKLTFY